MVYVKPTGWVSLFLPAGQAMAGSRSAANCGRLVLTMLTALVSPMIEVPLHCTACAQRVTVARVIDLPERGQLGLFGQRPREATYAPMASMSL